MSPELEDLKFRERQIKRQLDGLYINDPEVPPIKKQLREVQDEIKKHISRVNSKNAQGGRSKMPPHLLKRTRGVCINDLNAERLKARYGSLQKAIDIFIEQDNRLWS